MDEKSRWKKIDPSKSDRSPLGYNMVLILKIIIPCKHGIYMASKILLLDQIGFWLDQGKSQKSPWISMFKINIIDI